LVAICTISVSPLPSSSRTGPVVDSTGLIRHHNEHKGSS
jgi:hypothetical protein